jgi:outer membrane protein
VHGQDVLQEQKQAWTLESCITHALEHNIDLRQRIEERALREIDLSTSVNSRLPNLNAGISQNFDFGRSPSKDGIIVDNNSSNSSASLQLNMPVFDGFRITNRIAADRLNLSASTAALERAREDLAVGVASYFLQVLYNKEIYRIALMQVELTAAQVTRTESLVTLGKLPASQLYDIKAQLAKDEASLTTASNNVSLSLLDLSQSLELERLDSFDIVMPELTDVLMDQAGSLIPPDEIYRTAVTIKPVIKEQEFLLESQRRQLKIAQSSYYPQLSLNASYSNGYYHYSGGENVSNVTFGNQLRQNERKTIGLSLSIPIFNRFEVRNGVRSARVAIRNRELMMEGSKKTLYKEIQQAYLSAVSAGKQYVSVTRSVEASREAFTYAEERYAAGKSSVFEYNESKTKYAQSLAEQAQAKYDFIFRAKILDFYNGKAITLE